MRLLLIEDNEENAAVYRRILKDHQLRIAKNGMEGMKAFREETPEVALIDFDLPDVSGMQIGLSIRTQMEAGSLPAAILVALTAQSDQATLLEAQRCGFHAFVGKPCTEEDLLRTLSEVTRKDKTGI